MNLPTITVNEELRAYIDPLTPEEHQALERSILAEGCRDALVLWGDVLVDGHNRYGICSKHGIPFQTVQNTRFKSMDDVHLWMIDQHLGRRSVSDFQRGVLALRKKEIVATRTLPAAPAEHSEHSGNSGASAEQPLADAQAPVTPPDRLNTREAIAKAARISANTVVQIEKIQKSATPELVEAVKAGTISINAAATVASLPEEEQKAAVAGGKKELQQAAKRVREGKSGRRAELAGDAAPDDENSTGDPKAAEPLSAEERDQRNREAQVKLLQSTVQELTEENKALKAQVASLTAQLNAATSADNVE
ncbi:plasmid replication/partition related protein [Roseateles koreensis]|uniref:Plasmid replication/partition related protein n=1 Tax=Roseateles koreensis TaxID=2987526 RepID=A0ABT5KNH9_9BURK|nr:plasmid replication/partition related protein [Roseateles koreensis]MDC8783923.1 plasmid replication/partition related protein [Roseateles koreensis]